MKTNGQEAYLADIGRACDDLGWSIRDMDVGRITVAPTSGKSAAFAFVTLDTDRLPVTGDLLRALLRPLRAAAVGAPSPATEAASPAR